MARGAGREAITAAAREVFHERGYHGASIRDIARRAGLSLSALYYWHPSKQDLLAALVEEGIQDYFRRCAEALARVGDDPAERIRAMVRAAVEFRVSRQIDSNIAAREYRNLTPEHAARLDGLRRRATRLWSDIVDEGVRQGVFRCEHPEEARRAAQAACNAISQWYDPTGPLTTEDLVARYTPIVLRIVAYHPA